MKQFKDLQAGDIVYYYDHCTMKPRTVKKIEWDIKEENTNDRWFDQQKRVYKDLYIYFENRSRPLNVYCSWNDGAITVSGIYFSCKEAAEQWLNGLKRYRERRIERAKYLIEKETKILSKYKFND